ncbi:MAG: HAMP domain-containing histidine kinase [Oscillospiraceae bacterium]|jgi:signal transduction histidine kinase|nr:HAMP domain-containing histidine kinase [Oscillospiraceae bacterium]
MFKKIRNRIMLSNMAMVSAVVLAAFAVIFVTTYTREKESNRSKLTHGVTPQMTFAGAPFPRSGGFAVAAPWASGVNVAGFERRILPGAGLSFSLLVDVDGNVVGVNSVLELHDAVYRQAALDVVKKGGSGATIAMDGRIWQYSVSPVTIEFSEPNGISYLVTGMYNDIRFLDVTDSSQLLLSLGLTLSGLTIIILAIFFFISRFFANRAIRPMEEAWEKQSRFVADASHELKTPLSIINANCGVLYANSEETMDSQTKWVDSIMRATDRMTGLVGDLLSLSRMEDKEHEFRAMLFSLSDTVSDAVSEMEPAALEKGLFITRGIDPDIEVESDRGQVFKVLSILMDNAIKYTDRGGEISVCLRREKRYAEFAIRNSGEGIAPENLPRLFDRFYRGDPSRSYENGGHGLGLSIARAIAERLGAKLSADSEPGQYAEFRFQIDL